MLQVAEVNRECYVHGPWVCTLYTLQRAAGFTGVADIERDGVQRCKLVSESPRADIESVSTDLRTQCEAWIAEVESRR